PPRRRRPSCGPTRSPFALHGNDALVRSPRGRRNGAQQPRRTRVAKGVDCREQMSPVGGMPPLVPVSSADQFPRSKSLPRQSPLFWVAEKDRYLRQLLLRDIQDATG